MANKKYRPTNAPAKISRRLPNMAADARPAAKRTKNTETAAPLICVSLRLRDAIPLPPLLSAVALHVAQQLQNFFQREPRRAGARRELAYELIEASLALGIVTLHLLCT